MYIEWVNDDLKSHKKYFYSFQKFKNKPIITVDDDVIYSNNMVSTLINSYKKHPNCISCNRANLILLRKDKSFRSYETWPMNYTLLKDTPSYQLLPTGVGGIIYPPYSLPSYTFDKNAIINNCLLCDDLWLKAMAVINNIKTVLVENPCDYSLIEGSQEVALWKENVQKLNNDKALKNICLFIEKNIPNGSNFKKNIFKDRFC